MELKRRVGDWMSLILILGSIATALAVSGHDNKTGQNLDCTNDGDKWNCQFEAQNCSEYNLTLKINDEYEERHCILKQCDTGLCCCSVKMEFVPGEIHTATVWNRSENIESKNIKVTNSLKPKTPTITSVNESNGNFVVRWKTNMEGYVGESLSACVTYHKKGDTKKVGLCEPFKPTTVDGLNYYEILGEHLEPSTTYVVSVKSHTNLSYHFSDSSEEREFTTRGR